MRNLKGVSPNLPDAELDALLVERNRRVLEAELARRNMAAFVSFTKRDYCHNRFSRAVCEALDLFLEDVRAGKRPILILQAPPQHGKSELVSRRFPAYAFGRFPFLRIAACSYASDLARDMNRDVQRIMLDDSYKAVYVGLSSMQDYGAAYKKGISTGIRGMCVYNGKLVISNVFANATTGESGATILASSNPSEGFTVIASQRDLFDYPAYTYRDSIYGGSVWDMVEYNGHLYVSICTGTEENAPDDNTMQSFAIVRGDENADGTFTWTPLIGDQEKDGARYTFGIDPERTRSGAANLIVYKDHLYIGEYNDEQIAMERILFNKTGEGSDGSLGGVDCSFVNANLEQSVNLYRMDKDENIELLVGDATTMFPNGGISGIGSGFGHNDNSNANVANISQNPQMHP